MGKKDHLRENSRLQVTVSPANINLLTRWGAFHGKSAAEYAGQIIADACSANLDLILKLDAAREELEEDEANTPNT